VGQRRQTWSLTQASVATMNSTRSSLIVVAMSALAGCSSAFDQIKADVPDFKAQSRYPLRAGFQVVDASTLMQIHLLNDSDGDEGYADLIKPFPFGQVLRETAAGALAQLFEESQEANPNETYDLLIEMRLGSIGWKSETHTMRSDEHCRAIGSMRVLSPPGHELWVSTQNEVLQEFEGGGPDTLSGIREGVSGAISLLVKGWLTELQRSHVADRLAAKLGKTSQPSVFRPEEPPASSSSTGSEPARTPAWVQKAGAKQEGRLAVLEFSGPLEATVLNVLSDEVRSVALKAVAEHHCSVMTRESMAVILKDMGRGECQEGDCEVETARNIGADFVVSGIVVKIEGSLVATLKLHETARGSLLASARATAPTALDLIEAIKRSSAELFR
jgi:hypothetical protein